MLKHDDIIQKLDTAQKVAVISSALGEEQLLRAGVQPVRKVALEELGKGAGLSYYSAARTWNIELLGKMTAETVARGGELGYTLFITPDLKTAVNPYAAGLSEDPFLNGAIGGEIARAVKEAGGAVALYRLSADEDCIAYLDVRENMRALYELLVKPFVIASRRCECDVAFADPSSAGGAYYAFNRALFNDAQSGLFGDVFVVGESSSPATEAPSLLNGRVALGGSEIPIDRAVNRYLQLQSYEKEGSVSRGEIEDAVISGNAIAADKLDEAADGVIDFALNMQSLSVLPATPSDGGESYFKRAAEESIVLLKNNGVLPLAVGADISVLGDAYSDLGAIAEKFNVKGAAKGYDRARARSESYLPAALRAANGADVAVVFLTPDISGRQLALPPNRIALLDALKRGGKKIVAVVAGDLPVDMSFDGYTDGLLLAPAEGEFAADALARILCGETDPSGRLSRTCVDRADEYFDAFRADRNSGEMKIGQFTGYRRYDALGKKARYPFGFGLSYTKFRYSDLTVSADKAQFRLTNCGQTDGFEVAQLYVGAPSVSSVQPKKTLRGFTKVFLKAGESVTVTLPLGRDAFSTYDPLMFSDDVEGGEYAIYIGSSVQNIRLSGKIVQKGVKREKLGESKSDYFPEGELGDAGTVGKSSRVRRADNSVPKSLKAARTAALYALPAIALVFFLLVSVVILAYALDYILLSVADKKAIEWIMYVIAVCVLALAPLLGSLNRRRLIRMRTVAFILTPLLIAVCFILGGIILAGHGGRAEELAFRAVTCFAVGVPVLAVVAVIIERQLWRTKSGANKWDKYYFGREKEESATPDEQFEEAFKAVEEARAEKAERVEEAQILPLPAAERVQFYEKPISYQQLISDLTKFLSERGISADPDCVKNYVAAVFSTRLIVVPPDGGAEFCAAAAEYFGKKAYTDSAAEYGGYGDLFMRWRQSGNVNCPTNLNIALLRATRESAYLHTAIIRHVKHENIGKLFAPFAEALSGRRETLPLSGGRQTPLPRNLLIIVEAEEGDIYNLPAEIAEVAAVIEPTYTKCEPAEKKSVLRAVDYAKTEAMTKPVRDMYPLEEELWKKIDALDGKCAGAHIGNRLWIRLETHSSVIYACGGSGGEALDGAISAELLPWLKSVWNEKACGGLDGAFEEIFGDVELPRSKKIIAGGENA